MFTNIILDTLIYREQRGYKTEFGIDNPHRIKIRIHGSTVTEISSTNNKNGNL